MNNSSALLQDQASPILLTNEVLQSLGRILSNSPPAQEEFRKCSGFIILESYIQNLKGALSPDASYGRTGLPKAELAQKIDAVFTLLSAATRGSATSTAAFSARVRNPLLTNFIHIGV